MLPSHTTLNAAIASVITGTARNDTLNGSAADDTLYGLAGSDNLNGGAGNDSLDGGSGSDYLKGGAGNDILYGGAGSFPDWLDGGLGNDDYLFGRGDGHDFVSMSDARALTEINTLRLREGVLPSDLVFGLRGTALLINIVGTSDEFSAFDFLKGNDPTNNANPLQQIVFADGATWNLAEIKAKLYADAGMLEGSDSNEVLSGLTGDDYLDAKGGDDTLSGGGGRDTVYGGAGDDVIDGGTGNDILYGGAGNDTYLFGYGDGEDAVTLSTDDASGANLDTLQFKEGVQASDLRFMLEHNSLIVQLAGTNDMVSINMFAGDLEQYYAGMAFDQIRLHDGTTISRAQIEALFYTGTAQHDKLTANFGDNVLTGLAGNDTLDGGAGKDTIEGGAGNDLIAGGIGNDTYVFGQGDGQDTLLPTSVADVQGKIDTLQLKAGIGGADLQLTSEGTSLIIRIAGSSDQVTVTGFVKPNNTTDTTMPLQQIAFADGLSWDLARINAELAADSAPASASASLAGIDALQVDIGLIGMATPALA